MSRHIPDAIKRKLLEETQFRCAFCLASLEHSFDDSSFFHFAENAHVTPYNETADNSFENLICLCPTCHTKFDKNPNKQGSVARLKDLKKHWFVASGNYSKLELDCLFALFQSQSKPWLIKKSFTSTQGPVVLLSFSVPSKQGYLFQSLIINKLVQCIEEKGAFSGNSLTLGPNLPAEDTLWLILTDLGKSFCQKFNP